MEQLIQEGLESAGLRYSTDQGGQTSHRLDFHLEDFDLAIEVKRFHSDRISEQMARHSDVIAVQGEVAIRFFADLLTKAAGAYQHGDDERNRGGSAND